MRKGLLCACVGVLMHTCVRACVSICVSQTRLRWNRQKRCDPVIRTFGFLSSLLTHQQLCDLEQVLAFSVLQFPVSLSFQTSSSHSSEGDILSKDPQVPVITAPEYFPEDDEGTERKGVCTALCPGLETVSEPPAFPGRDVVSSQEPGALRQTGV